MIIEAIIAVMLAQAPAQPFTTPTPESPKLTKEQSLQVQNFNLRSALINEQLQELQHAQKDLQAEIAQFKSDVEKEHPDWVWDPQTGEWKHKDKDKK